MAFSYGFFNAQLDTNGGYDRVYTAEHFAEYFHLFVGNGVFADPATSLQVINSLPASMNVVVSAGYGWINGYYAKNTDEYPLTLNVAHASLPRYDAVVLRWANETKSMELAVLTGLAAASPVVPTLTRNTEVYELMLAAIRVEAGATNITQSAITDKRPDNTVCGWVTSLIDQIDTTNLFAQYNAEFTEWFDNIKAQLSGNVATNLQNQINERLKIADKATVAEAQAGTNDTHYMTPDKVDDFYQAHKATTAEAQAGTNTNKFLTPASGFLISSKILMGYRYEEITESKTWTAPDNLVGNSLFVLLFGAGGGGGEGAYSTSRYLAAGGGGGGGHLAKGKVEVVPGQSYNIVIGLGGAGGSGRSGQSSGNPGFNGGTTKAFGLSANGGNGGAGANYNTGGRGGDGGTGGGAGGGGGSSDDRYVPPNSPGGNATYGGGGGGKPGGSGGNLGGNGRNGASVSGETGIVVIESSLPYNGKFLSKQGNAGMQAYGGGGGYGVDGGTGYSEQYTYSGGGGGGYGGAGGKGDKESVGGAKAGGGGGGGYFDVGGAGGDGGGGGYTYNNSNRPGKSGQNGVVVLMYWVKE